jgi:hypothetical protein
MGVSSKWGGGQVLALSTSGEGANSLLLRLHFSPHQSLLHCTLTQLYILMDRNGTAYNGTSSVQHNYFCFLCSLTFKQISNFRVHGKQTVILR